MSIRDNKRLVDGFQALSSGMDSGRAPSIIGRDQVSFAINSVFRGGFIHCRPGWNKQPLTFASGASQSVLQNGLFQGGIVYSAPTGESFIVVSIAGHLFKISNSNVVTDISIAGDYNSSFRKHAYFVQAEEFLIVQDGSSKPIIFDGLNTRRAEQNEIPVGTVMEYGMGRIWFSFPDKKSFGATDLIYGPSGTSTYGYRDAVYKYTENTFLNEGGAFTTGSNAGEIRAIRAVPTLDSSLGQGPIQVLTTKTIFSVNAPLDRTTWKDVQFPIQTVSLSRYGGLSQNSVVLVNGDIWYRSLDGIRSFQLSRRDFRTWVDTPQSNEIQRVLNKDDVYLLEFASGVLFDNRLLMTVSPLETAYGTMHRGLVSLDFNPSSSMREKAPPEWDGLWTGFNVLQLLIGDYAGVERCFSFVLNASNKIELWELSRADRFDNGTVRIQWSMESASYGFGNSFGLKRLATADLSIDKLAGVVNIDMKFKPDQYPCWVDWHSWSECAQIEDCLTIDALGCQTLKNFHEQYRARMRLPVPTDACDPVTGTLYCDGYEFSARIEITGYCEIKQMRLHAYDRSEEPFGECRT